MKEVILLFGFILTVGAGFLFMRRTDRFLEQIRAANKERPEETEE